jgi:hypothetical protein
MLWFQVVLLDIAIRLTIKRRTDKIDAIESYETTTNIITEAKETLKAVTMSYLPSEPDNLHKDGLLTFHSSMISS